MSGGWLLSSHRKREHHHTYQKYTIQCHTSTLCGWLVNLPCLCHRTREHCLNQQYRYASKTHRWQIQCQETMPQDKGTLPKSTVLLCFKNTWMKDQLPGDYATEQGNKIIYNIMLQQVYLPSLCLRTREKCLSTTYPVSCLNNVWMTGCLPGDCGTGQGNIADQQQHIQYHWASTSCGWLTVQLQGNSNGLTEDQINIQINICDIYKHRCTNKVPCFNIM